MGLGAVEQPQIVITGGMRRLDLKPFIDGLERAKHVLTVGPTSARLVHDLQDESRRKFDSRRRITAGYPEPVTPLYFRRRLRHSMPIRLAPGTHFCTGEPAD